MWYNVLDVMVLYKYLIVEIYVLTVGTRLKIAEIWHNVLSLLPEIS